ncbi:MAG: hypothetical protein KAS72_08925 [Phycisphaerales bacterium]|nr:hypothetical protein [Phycisphaerales bacterium]
MSTIALVSCVKSKRSSDSPARDLYTSALFRKMRAYAERNADGWYVLSAKYGLVHPGTIIEPYELTLKTMSRAERRAWADAVHKQMQAQGLLQPGRTFLWLAGRPYKEDLAGLLAGYSQEDPLAGMQIGVRLQWLNQQLQCG